MNANERTIKEMKDQLAALNKQQKEEEAQPCGGRMNARGVLEDRAEQLKRQAAGIRDLLKALPAELPPPADEALWHIVLSSR